MSLDKVESVDVNQSILGRLMNYGDITIQGVGEGTQTISTIASRSRFAMPSRQDRSARKSRHGVPSAARRLQPRHGGGAVGMDCLNLTGEHRAARSRYRLWNTKASSTR
jgi:hypothetical protein